MAMIKCPECNEDISDKAEECIHCGYKLIEKSPRFCAECGTKLKANAKTCHNCGCPIENDEEDNNLANSQDDSSKLRCPHCGSDNIQVQIVSQAQNSGCLTVIFYVILALTIVGIPIMILILLLKGKKSVNYKYYVCQNCGRTFNPNEKSNNIVLLTILIIIIALVVLLSL